MTTGRDTLGVVGADSAGFGSSAFSCANAGSRFCSCTLPLYFAALNAVF